MKLSKQLTAFLILVVCALAANAASDIRTSLTAADTKGRFSFLSVDRQISHAKIQGGRAELTDEITGEISFPGSGFFGGGVKASENNKIAAMVIMHSSSGVTKAIYDWASYLNSLGVATLIVDSFTPRGIARTAEDQSQLERWTSGADALMALKILATHPLIDRNRIGVMGFSRGGTATQIASFDSIRTGLFGKDSDLMYAGHIQFYGGCAVSGKTTGKPILLLTGSAEDYQPAANCQYVHDIMKAQGANISIKIYPGAYHGFDVGFPVAFRPKVSTASKCVVINDADTGMSYVKDSATPFTPVPTKDARQDKCERGIGAHSGNNPDAARQSKLDVAEFIEVNLQK